MTSATTPRLNHESHASPHFSFQLTDETNDLSIAVENLKEAHVKNAEGIDLSAPKYLKHPPSLKTGHSVYNV